MLGGATQGALFFRLRLGGEDREHFEVAFLNTQFQLIAVERLFSGTIDAAEVHPRIVVQRALAHNASAVLMAHNHPSGSLQPSASDRAVTARLRKKILVDQFNAAYKHELNLIQFRKLLNEERARRHAEGDAARCQSCGHLLVEAEEQTAFGAAEEDA